MAGPNPPPPDLDPTAWYVVVVGGADFETCKTNLKALMYRTLGNHEIRDVDECHISIDVERPYIRMAAAMYYLRCTLFARFTLFTGECPRFEAALHLLRGAYKRELEEALSTRK